MTRRRLTPGVIARARLTDREVRAMTVWHPDPAKRRGYNKVALALDVSRETARDCVRNAIRKLEKATRVAA